MVSNKQCGYRVPNVIMVSEFSSHLQWSRGQRWLSHRRAAMMIPRWINVFLFALPFSQKLLFRSLSFSLSLSLSFSLSLSLQNVFGYCHRISCRRRYPTDFCSIGTKTSVHWRKYFGQNVDTLNANISWFLPLGIYLRLLGQSKIQPCLGHGFFLLWLKDCLLEACMLMGEVRIQELR